MSTISKSTPSALAFSLTHWATWRLLRPGRVVPTMMPMLRFDTSDLSQSSLIELPHVGGRWMSLPYCLNVQLHVHSGKRMNFAEYSLLPHARGGILRRRERDILTPPHQPLGHRHIVLANTEELEQLDHRHETAPLLQKAPPDHHLRVNLAAHREPLLNVQRTIVDPNKARLDVVLLPQIQRLAVRDRRGHHDWIPAPLTHGPIETGILEQLEPTQ